MAEKADKNLGKVSIVTLNWNTTEVTCAFLRSIERLGTYKNCEVIVVDNASTIDPTSAFKSAYPAVKVIVNKVNLGFSGGNNVGIKAAKGDYIFIVNNDTEFTPGLIENLVVVFDTFPDVGLVSPKFHYYYNKGIIEYAGYQKVNAFTGRNGMVGCGEKDNGQYNELVETNYAHGGGMMISRNVLNEVGLMPEPFFLYYEEFDWSEQIKRKGYKIYYQPDALIYHKESMTTGKSSPLKTFYLTRNRILFMKRNVRHLGFVAFILYFFFFTAPKNTFQFLFKGKKDHLISFWKGVFWHVNNRITFN